MTTAHFDLDCIKYGAASAGETRSVLITHKATGRQITLPNRTAFYGHWKKKEGGMLAEINKEKGTSFVADDFEYEDVQEPEPIENILHTAKLMVEKAVAASGADDVVYYIGKGDPFRVELSTLLKYKGQRTNMLKPVLLGQVTEYLTNKYKAEVVEYYEVDDVVVMNSYGKKDHFILGLDKDYAGSGSNFFNMNMPEKSIQNTNCLGELYIDDKGYVKGFGRMFKLFQVCSSDASDNYAANCVSDLKWGEKSAYNALKDCKTDRELFQASVDIFKKLYPEPKVVEGWRGDKIEIDWLYVMQECMNMAHLHRKPDDFIDLKAVFDKLGIEV
jgi:hypothetical protein